MRARTIIGNVGDVDVVVVCRRDRLQRRKKGYHRQKSPSIILCSEDGQRCDFDETSETPPVDGVSNPQQVGVCVSKIPVLYDDTGLVNEVQYSTKE